jgi:hypothetical protein
MHATHHLAAREYCRSLLLWYPTKGGLRSRLGSIELNDGVFLSSLAGATINQAASRAMDNPFSVPLYLVESDEAQRIAVRRREAAFLAAYLRLPPNAISRLWTCTEYIRWTAGRMGAGRDELVVLVPLAEDFRGSSYEGWSTTKFAPALQDAEVVEDVMMQ